MHARSTTFHGRPDGIEAGIKYVTQEVGPALDRIEGCRGLSLLVDRSTGEGILTSSWSSREALDMSDDALRAMRDRGRDLISGGMEVDTWEIASMHRSAHGDCCRVSWLEGPTDRMTDLFRFGVVPALSDERGFCSASLLINPETGMGCATTTWRTQGWMEQSRVAADELRGRVAKESGGKVLAVHEYELAFAHLHVPEMV